MSDTIRAIGEAIRRERKRKNLTLKQLAEMVNCSEQAISQYERNVRPLKSEMLIRISEALDVSIYSLFKPEVISFDMTEAVQEIGHLYSEDQLERIKKSADILRDIVGDDDAERAAILLRHFHELNVTGQEKAISYVSDLEEIARYAKPNPLDVLNRVTSEGRT